MSICKFSMFVMVTWPLVGFRGLYLPNAWSQTLQASKRHTFPVSAFHRYNVTHRQLLSIDQVWRRSTALTWSRWGCRQLADNIWLLAHANNNRYNWFGLKLFPVGCAQDSRMVP